MLKLKLLIAIVFSSFAVGVLVSNSVHVNAQSDAAVCEGIGAAEGSSGCNDPAGSTTINTVLRTLLNILSIIAGMAAVIMIIIAGIRYITSSGESNNVAGAKNALIYALVGLVVVVISQSLVRFVINRLDDRPSSVQTITCPDGRVIPVGSAAGGAGSAALCNQ